MNCDKIIIINNKKSIDYRNQLTIIHQLMKLFYAKIIFRHYELLIEGLMIRHVILIKVIIDYLIIIIPINLYY